MSHLRAAIAVALLVSAPAFADEKARLQQLLDQDWEYQMREFPTFATEVGDPRYDDRWQDLSREAVERRKEHERELVKQVESIDRAQLGPDDQLTYDLFRRDAKLAVEGRRFPEELLQIDQMGGVHSALSQLAEIVPKRNVTDVENFLKRIDRYPVLVDQGIALLREGLQKGITPPKITLRDVGKLIENQISDDPTKSPVYTEVLAKLPDSIPAAERTRLQARARQLLTARVMPALRKLHKFVVEEYEPKARTSIGLSALPDGAAWYAYNVKRSTTTDLTPEQIHQIGLTEVKRIRAEMEGVMRATGYKGTLEQFFQFLRTDPQFFFTDKQALLSAYRDIAKRIDPELPRLFGRLPRLSYGVRPVPAHAEKTQTTAYYNPGAPDAGRPGWFYANTYDLPSRPKWEMEALTLHEAVPGHHLQIALAQELGELPKFRRYGGYTAFVEGWGLYAESLGKEMGLFTDPYSKFGALTYEMWRAIRLVVDTGMHAKGWTRDQALAFFRANAGKSEHDITVEVDRYIVWPGQALAYKIGQLKLRELRAAAEKQLGAKFDPRAFHDVVLGAGALPLDVLEARVRDWLRRTAGANKKA
jgi:uncharacterized protein (DUF885 family)